MIPVVGLAGTWYAPGQLSVATTWRAYTSTCSYGTWYEISIAQQQLDTSTANANYRKLCRHRIIITRR